MSYSEPEILIPTFPDYRESFLTESNVFNIEFGAGKGYFGKKEFELCYLTDKEIGSVEHRNNLALPVLGDCHFLDKIGVDFFSYDFKGFKFNTLIFCNPFGYGFRGKNEATRFLNRAENLLTKNGELFIVGQGSNNWVVMNKVQKWVDLYNAENESSTWQFSQIEEDKIADFNERHIFRKTTGEHIKIQLGYTLKLA